MDFNLLGAVLSERLEVHGLSPMLQRIPESWLNAGGEILDFQDAVLWAEDSLAERKQVQPLVRCAAKRPVVEVQAVDVDIGAQDAHVRPP